MVMMGERDGDNQSTYVTDEVTKSDTSSDMEEPPSDLNGTGVLAGDGIVMTKEEHSLTSTSRDSIAANTLVEDGPSLSVEHDMSPTSYQMDSSTADLSHYQPIIYVNSDGHVSIPGDQNLLLNTDSHAGALHLDHGDFTLSVTDESTDMGQNERNSALQSDCAIEDAKVINIIPSSLALAEQAPTAVSESNGLQTLMIKTPAGELVQVIPVQSLSEVTTVKTGNRLVQVLPVGVSSLQPTLLVQGTMNNNNGGEHEKESQAIDITSGVPLNSSLASIILSSNPIVPKVLPPGTPSWAARINECEKIGNSYRGWVESEVDLDLLLTYHKQETNSFWGTRQSPSPAKPSTRLMWKSQYVHFDGIPFINTGSRAIVLECEFGPRRKGAQAKRQLGENSKGEFRQTCPARIYIKKVKKFPEFAVDVNQDKKMLRFAMDRAFTMLRKKGIEHGGQERYYVQLPTEEAHEFHGDIPADGPHRLDPRVSNKIRELVSKGETKLYVIRKMLRQFVEKELFSPNESLPEKHNLTYYPTVNDLQNHIHQAIRDIEIGVLPLDAPHMTVQMLTDAAQDGNLDCKDFSILHQLTGSDTEARTESVTVTLTQNPEEDGQHVISKVETHLSDGTTQITTNLSPETAKLLSKLHPNLFPSADSMAIDQQIDSPETNESSDAQLTSVTQDIVDHHQVEVTLSSQSPTTQYIIMETPADEILMDQEMVAGLKTEVLDLDVSMETEENHGLIKLERDSEIICQYQSPVAILDHSHVTQDIDGQVTHKSSVDSQLSHTGSMSDHLEQTVIDTDMTNSGNIDENMEQTSVLTVNQC